MSSGADYCIRFAESDEAREIAALHADSWRRHYRGAYSDRYLDDEADADRMCVWTERLGESDAGRFTLVAAERTSVVGFVHLVLDADPKWGALIDNLHVVHSSQRHGVGTRLLAAAAGIVIDRRPGSGLYLWVQEQNRRALAFYMSRCGEPGDRELVSPPRSDPRNLDGAPVKIRISWPDPATSIHS